MLSTHRSELEMHVGYFSKSQMIDMGKRPPASTKAPWTIFIEGEKINKNPLL